ncbi:MAG: molecular chaperone TorD family protein [Pseudomonadota bacterium]
MNDDEEAARAALYGLLGDLFYGAPGQALLDAIVEAPAGGDGVLRDAWQVLARACRTVPANAIAEEYETLFIGTGRPELMLYGSFYLSGFMMEKPLARLRSDLAALGLERAPAVPESEDHIAALCHTLRHLAAYASLEVQKDFFQRHLAPWAGTMCEAISAHPRAAFYPAVAQFAQLFFEVEAQAFEMV